MQHRPKLGIFFESKVVFIPSNQKKSLRLDPVEFCRVVFQKCIPIPMSVSSAWVYLWRHNPNPREPFSRPNCVRILVCAKPVAKIPLINWQDCNSYAHMTHSMISDHTSGFRWRGRLGAAGLTALYTHSMISGHIPGFRWRGRSIAAGLSAIPPFNEIGAYIGIPLARPLNRRGAKCSIPHSMISSLLWGFSYVNQKLSKYR